jgi:hypothetical protein
LNAFGNATLSSVRAVRFTFDKQARGSIFLANVRMVKSAAGGAPAAVVAAAPALEAAPLVEAAPAPVLSMPMAGSHEVLSIRRLVGAGTVEIELASSQGFAVGGSLPRLNVGPVSSTRSRFASAANDILVFALSQAAYDSLPQGAPVEVRLGARRYPLGILDKTMAR